MDIKEYKKNQNIVPSRHPWEVARLEVIFSNLKPHFKEKNKTIYDIGCGDVYLLRELAERTKDINLVGIDIEFSDEMIADFSNSKKIKLFRKIEEIKDKSLDADIILLLDIIEHIEDVDKFLSEILNSGRIKKNALIIITVPAFNFLFTERDKWLGHYRRYNLKELRKIAENHKLQNTELKYFFTSLFFARFIQKLIEKVRKPDTSDFSGIGDYKEKKVFDFLFRNFLLFDYWIGNILYKLGIKLPGLSCMAIFTKQE